MDEPSLPVNQILAGDCKTILEVLPERSVDLIFADPPYNLQLQQELRRPNNSRVDAVNDDWDQFDSFEAYDHFTRSWLNACRRVLKDTGTIWVIGTYHNIYRIGAIIQDLGFWLLNDVVWVKSNPMPNFRGVRFTNAQETLIWAQKERGGRYTFNHQVVKALNDDLQMRSDWYLPICTGKERLKTNGKKAHAAQKPEALLYRVISSSSKAGDVVLDPFFGTGTTGVVAQRLHRRWIGIERDDEYIKLARERIDRVQPVPYSDDVFLFENKRDLRRVPFGTLVERGLLQPGQELYLRGRRDEPAIILANGHIRCQDQVGSIHQVAKSILNAACNGWEQWYYLDEASGKLEVIDRLRQQVRDEDR